MESLYAALPIFAQNWVCGIAGRRRLRARRTPHFHRTLEAWEQSIDGPLDALRALQAERLRALVSRARTWSPYWASLPPPAMISDPEEAIARILSSIPPLDKETYRANARAIRARDIPAFRLVSSKTSGTTGTALAFHQTRECLAEWYAVAWRQRRRAGARLDDPYLTFGGQLIVPLGQASPPFWRHNRPGRQTLFSNYHLAPENLPAYVDAIHATPARYVQGYPSALTVVANALLDAARPLPAGRLAAIFTSSETLLAAQRRAIEAAFGAPVQDYYSSAEMAVAMTSCSAGRWHVDLEFCVVEVEVQERGPGFERGPLLVTGLATDATPLLRYRIGDVGTRATTECPCGRPGDAFLEIDGRIEDYLVTPDGRRIGRLDHVFKDDVEVAEAQILQDTADAMTLRFVPRPGFDAEAERRLVAALRVRVGHAIRIQLERVGSLPREPNGKLRAVKSRVGALRR